jgi:hypothetical protein
MKGRLVKIKKELHLFSHLHPQFLHIFKAYILNIHSDTSTLKLTRWLPRQTTHRLFFYYIQVPCPKDPQPKGTCQPLTSPGWYGDGRRWECTPSRIHHRIDKGEVPMVHCLTAPLRRILGWCNMSDRMANKPRDQTVRARTKKLTWGNKRVAANGLTNKDIIPTIKVIGKHDGTNGDVLFMFI